MNLNTKKQKLIAKGVGVFFLCSLVFCLSYIFSVQNSALLDSFLLDEMEDEIELEVVYGFQDNEIAEVKGTADGYYYTQLDSVDDDLDEEETASVVVSRTRTSTSSTSYDSSFENVTLSLSSSDGGETEPKVGEHSYEKGTVVVVSAVADEGYHFVSWVENGVIVSLDSEYTFEIHSNRFLIANFAKTQYSLTVIAGQNGSVSSVADIYAPGDVVGIEAVADDGYVFSHWSGDVDGVKNVKAATTTVQMNDEYEILANFVEKAELNISASEGGATQPNVGKHIYPKDTLVEIKALPSEGYNFVAWVEDDAVISESESYVFEISTDRDLQAKFEKKKYSLTISAGKGGVIKHGDTSYSGSQVGEYVYEHGEIIELKGLPDSGYDIDGWIVNGESSYGRTTFRLTMDRNYEVKAEFTGSVGLFETHVLTISSNIGGSVSTPGEGNFSYNLGDSVNLLAVAELNYSFSHWSGDVLSVDDIYSESTFVTVAGDHSIQANFVLNVGGTATVLNNGYSVLFDTDGANVAVNPYTAEMLRYAWSDEVGWIDFDNVSIDKSSGQVLGTATVLLTGQKVYFDEAGDGSNSEVYVDLAHGTFSGYAWSDDIGWIELDNVSAPGIHSKSIIYDAGVGGSILGDTFQSVPFWGTSTEVTASPDLGYFFVQWSDGVTDNPRTDTNVIDDMYVTAEFELIGGVEIVDAGGQIASNLISFDSVNQSSEAQEANAVLGLSEQRMRVSKNNFDGGFNVYLSVLGSGWSDEGTNTYPHDSALAENGLLEIDPSLANVLGVGVCSEVGISLGIATNFFAHENIGIVGGDENSLANCQWDVTGVGLKQTIPGGAPAGVYTLELVLTML